MYIYNFLVKEEKRICVYKLLINKINLKLITAATIPINYPIN